MSSFNSEVGLLEKCRGCAKEFKPESLLRHVGKAKKCKAVYGSDYENLKKKKKLATKKKYHSRNRLEINEKQAKYDQVNRIWINAKRRKRYSRKKEEASSKKNFSTIY